MHYVSERWLGGTLTNFRTIRGSMFRDVRESFLRDDVWQPARLYVDRLPMKTGRSSPPARHIRGRASSIAPTTMTVPTSATARSGSWPTSRHAC